jgi:hypothetical protein
LTFQAQVYRISDILGWHDRRELVIAPEFQRRKVWSHRGRSYLIDSIIRGMPLPQFFIREKVLLREKRTVREVVDGQQRLTSILDYIGGKFAVLPMHNQDYAKLKYEQLPEAVQRNILAFPLSVNVLQGTDDAHVLEIFSRLNAYTVPLNRQEKLNAQYVGAFKQTIDDLAKKNFVYWRRGNILSAHAIARMRDVEFTAELVAAMLEGVQNQKQIIPQLYKKYDPDFPASAYISDRFQDTLGFCEVALRENIANSEFSRSSLFYSLFVAAYDLMYGLGSDAQAQRRRADPNMLAQVQESLLDLQESLLNPDVNGQYRDFYLSTRQSTDKIQQRMIRHESLMRLLAPCFMGH